MHEIREHMPGTTVVQKLNQGLSRRLGVLSGGGPFWVPWRLSDGNPAEASKKVQKRGRSRNDIV
jgi:hypothetical protein